MNNRPADDLPPKSHLDEISTRWSQVGDPLQFVMRYGPAIQKYLGALIENPDDAAEVCQEFLTNMLSHRFAGARPDQGRFRKYLKTAVRNAALMFFRRQRRDRRLQAAALERAEEPVAQPTADQEWLSAWQRCVLDRAWTALHQQQRRSKGLFYTVLRTATDHPDEDSVALAARVSKSVGRTLQPDAFRQQRSRARRAFAELVVHEVARTVEYPSPQAVEEELTETGLLAVIREFLPSDWRDWPCLKPAP